jgi:hypothetical protein
MTDCDFGRCRKATNVIQIFEIFVVNNCLQDFAVQIDINTPIKEFHFAAHNQQFFAEK